MAEIRLQNVDKIYSGGVQAAAGLNFQVRDRELLVLVGPSGCGKSTILRMIAGLEDVTGGVIQIGDREVNDLPPKERDVALVHQNSTLYPHKNVRQNLAFGLSLRCRYGVWAGLFGRLFGGAAYKHAREERTRIEQAVEEMAELIGVHDLLERRPGTLSGGQQQRVAVGRAAVMAPKAFLFDEPLSNLDALTRTEMRVEIKNKLKNLNATALYVTHDQEEALTLGDRIAVMHHGVIRQIGEPMEVYRRPVDRFVAGFVGAPQMNFLEGKLRSTSAGLAFDLGDGLLELHESHQDRLTAYADQSVVMGIRPVDLSPVRQDSLPAGLCLTIDVIERLGDYVDLHAATSRRERIVCRTASFEYDACGPIRLSVNMSRAHFFEPGEFGRNIGL